MVVEVEDLKVNVHHCLFLSWVYCRCLWDPGRGWRRVASCPCLAPSLPASGTRGCDRDLVGGSVSERRLWVCGLRLDEEDRLPYGVDLCGSHDSGGSARGLCGPRAQPVELRPDFRDPSPPALAVSDHFPSS